MECNEMDRNLTCVLFPGIVKNEEKALECLGGIRSISQVYSEPHKKRIGLSFQPNNPLVKKIYADVKDTAGVLLKVKVKKTKEGNQIKREVISTSVVGRVKTLFKFDSMCDFQYLPVHKEGAGPPKCVLEQIIPSGLDQVDFLSGASPSFLGPSKFTWFDKPTNYGYSCKRYPGKDRANDEDSIHIKNRSERTAPSMRVDFTLTDEMPTEPHAYYLNEKVAKAAIYPPLEEEFELVKKKFEERPIMTNSLIKYYTKVKTNSLKLILPCIGYYMRTGPWRTTWVRFGYDPRKEPESRIYQILDYRLKFTSGFQSMVRTRGSQGNYKKVDRVRRVKGQKRLHPEAEVPDGAVLIKPGMVPTQRQTFYQYCDVMLPEVEAILAAEPPPGFLCHQKRGWLPPNVDDKCREYITRYIKETILNNTSMVKFEQDSSAEDSDSEEDTSSNAMDIDESITA